MRLRLASEVTVPVARLEPRNTGERVEATMARARHRANRITTNRFTRSGWFVGGIGVAMFLPVVILIAWAVYSLFHGGWGP